VAGSCEYGDEPSGSGAMELVIRALLYLHFEHCAFPNLAGKELFSGSPK
jgi:hypothetical protein